MSLKPLMTADELTGFLDTEFPQVNAGGRVYTVTVVRPGEAVLRLDPDTAHLRPGGTISGPTLFTLSDLAAYVAILAHIGPVALAVTTNLNINFLRKPEMAPHLATCRILKLGKRSAVVEVAICPEPGGARVAPASATYSIPPR